MPLSKEEIDDLIRRIGLTRDVEIDCEQCLALAAELAERAMADGAMPSGLDAFEHHLSICPECREDYEALLRALEAMDA